MSGNLPLTQRLEELIKQIDDMTLSITQGNIPLLGTLEQQVAKLCLDIEKSDPDTARQTQPLMAQMITKLDELAVTLQEFKKGCD